MNALALVNPITQNPLYPCKLQECRERETYSIYTRPSNSVIQIYSRCSSKMREFRMGGSIVIHYILLSKPPTRRSEILVSAVASHFYLMRASEPLINYFYYQRLRVNEAAREYIQSRGENKEEDECSKVFFCFFFKRIYTSATPALQRNPCFFRCL